MAAGLVAFIVLALVASSVESELVAEALLYGSVCCLYGLLTAWAVRCGGRRQLCDREHWSRSERRRCTRTHAGDYKSMLFLTALLFAVVVAIAFVDRIVAIGLLLFPLVFFVLALTYRPEGKL